MKEIKFMNIMKPYTKNIFLVVLDSLMYIKYFYSAMNHFFDNGAQVSLPMFNGMDITSTNKNKYIIAINAQHAVNVIAKTGPNIMYYDAQAGSYGYCTVPNITHIYEIR